MSEQTPHPNLWQRFNHRLAATPLAARVFSVTFHHLDRPVMRLSKGRTSITSMVTGLPVVTLTTLGAKSGQPRSVPLIGIPDGDKIVLIASNWGQTHHPGWYFNLRANPEASILRSGRTGKYLAHEAVGSEYDSYWSRAVELYIGYAAYKTRTGGRKIPIMVLIPTGQ
jgi:F420H(2)-dependent quinone reductase